MRLETIVKALGHPAECWDFCCDHGLVGRAVLLESSRTQVHFVDQVDELIASLRVRVEQEHTPEEQARAKFWTCDAGLIDQPVRGSVAIAGVGAYTIFGILESLITRGMFHADKVVLSPHKNEEWLFSSLSTVLPHDVWECEALFEVEERGRIRPIWVFRRILAATAR